MVINAPDLADVLSDYMDCRHYKPDTLSRLTADFYGESGKVSKPTIVRWINGGTKKPQDWSALVKIARALRLTEAEANRLMQAAGHPPISDLALINKEAYLNQLLLSWDKEIFGSTDRRRTTLQDIEIPPPPRPSPVPENPLFVGRATEIALVNRIINEKHLAVISGWTGIGKTALAAQVARQRAPAGKVYWYSFTKGDSVDEFIRNFAGFLSHKGKPDLWNLIQHTRLIGGEMPSIEEIYGYLVKLTDGDDYLLCLDDIQHVMEDPGLKKLIKRLIDSVKNISFSTLITTDCQLEFIPKPQEITLSGLGQEETRILLAPIGILMLEDTLARLHSKTSGNPRLLLMAKDTFQQGYDPDEFIKELADTSNVGDFLSGKIYETLSEPEKEVMSGLAVLSGYPGRREALETVLDRCDLRPALRRLVGRFLVTVHQDLEFSLFGLLQEFFYTSIHPSKRSEMHRRAASYYESKEENIPRAAFHYQRAGEPRLSAQLIVINTRTLLNRGHALMLQNVLMKFRENELDRDQWALVNLAQGKVETFLRDSQRARKSLQTALSVLESLPDSREKMAYQARTCQAMGELLELETPAEAMEWYRRGLGYVPAEQEGNRTAALHIKLGTVLNELGELDQAIEQAQAGLDLLPEAHSQIFVSGLITIGASQEMQGKYDDALSTYQKALAICEGIQDEFRAMQIAGNIAIVQEIQGDWRGAAEKHKNALGWAERLGAISEQAKLNNNLGVLYTNLGEFQVAEKYLTRSLNLVRAHQMPQLEAFVLTSLVDLSIRKEGWLKAEEYLSQGEKIIKDKDISYLLPYQLYYRAQLQLGWGDPAGAESAVRQAIDQAREMGLPFEEGLGYRVLGLALWSGKQQEQAIEAFEQSLNRLESDRYELARTKLSCGTCLLDTPEKARGISFLREAQAVFQQLGAQRELEWVEELLKDFITS